MGMDLISQKGTQRWSIWVWYPMWEYVSDACLLTEEERIGGRFNENFQIGPGKATQIGELLLSLLAAGSVSGYLADNPVNAGHIRANLIRDEFQKFLTLGSTEVLASPGFTEDDLRQFADFCLMSGGFRIC